MGDSRSRHRLFTDGGARGNPGPAGLGVVVVAADGSVVSEVAKAIGWATNNVAEYEGLIEGLRTARAMGIDDLDVFMDSKLVVEQMRGNFKVKHPGLKPLHETARKLAGQFRSISFTAVPRARNAHADELTNQAIDEWTKANPGFEGPADSQPGLF